ncbi:MAG: DUF4956 domain-containing protein [Saprospiraceae bacterium]|nr:DUF4956 domain-containing protein [Saprospiraceae bacterium]MCF8249524.1 DUF4956 domain-containing protein [Saprospiraceae bacterium]MCF8280149.1 DUF4956 domain-containing protein [Bacteroidales bacterium]MCF8310742.1 DUF4956 domain-containing protein [Saprospiraceae bacterium]MCF8439427.1 DUF4956 domain-containing protein [Saprospiraceae bacterium]
MFDFSLLQANTDNPALMSVVYAMLFSFLLSIVVAFTYEKTSRDLFVPGNFVQAMILGSMAAATVMLAIGDSLARGLGMIGALAIIHFRTNLRDPRNIIFMFASLAIGISCGVHGYNIAFIGTVSFCAAAFLLKWTPFSTAGHHHVNVLRFRLDTENGVAEQQMLQLLSQYCKRIQHWRSDYESNAEGILKTAYNYRVVFKKKGTEVDFLRAIKSLEGIEKIDLSTKSEPEAL